MLVLSVLKKKLRNVSVFYILCARARVCVCVCVCVDKSVNKFIDTNLTKSIFNYVIFLYLF